MSGLGSDARQLIASARAKEHVPSSERERVKARVLARVAAGAALVAAGEASATGGATAAPVAATWGIKLLIGVVVTTATGAIVFSLSRDPDPLPTAMPAATSSLEVSSAPAPFEPTPSVIASSSVSAPASVVPTSVRTPPRKKSRSSPSADNIDAQLEALRKAQAALRDGHAEDALAELEKNKGAAMEQERLATQVFALCQAGKHQQARSAARTFVKKFPGSPLVPRVRDACRDEDEAKK